jgi:Zn-dependent peptidase ImmA (M78 family)/transcriptional regulator with XRE-family HTH domain
VSAEWSAQGVLFSGARLQLARQARGLTVRALADISGLHANSIAMYEKGASQPKAETVNVLAERLNVLTTYFFAGGTSAAQSPVFYRSQAAATATSRTRAEARFRWTSDIIRFAEHFVDFPRVDVPEFSVPDDVTSISDRRVDEIAAEVRAHWGLGNGVIENMVWLLETHGVIVTRGEGGTRAIDAFSQWDDVLGRPRVFLCDDKGAAFRSRLDAAHELGHLVLHRRVPAQALRNPILFKQVEHQAFRFAAAFLLPAVLFAEYVPSLSLESLLIVKPILKASVKMMIKRGMTLGYVSTDSEQLLWRAYARRGWQASEPGDQSEPLEQPELLRTAIEYIVESKVRSRAELIQAIGLPSLDLEALCGLESGFLSPVKPMIRPTQPVDREAVIGVAIEQSNGRVLNFPTRPERDR